MSSFPRIPSVLGGFHRILVVELPAVAVRIDLARSIRPGRAGLVLLSELQQRHGFSLVVVILPEFRAPFDAYRSRAVHTRVVDEARDLPGVSVIDLLEDFANLDIDAEQLSYDDELHMNETGHAAMAAILLPIVLNAEKPGNSAAGKY